MDQYRTKIDEDELVLIERLDNDAISIELTQPSQAIRRWRDAKALAENRFARTRAAGDEYLIGYISYMLFSRGACSPDEVERHLLGTLRLVPEHVNAVYYIGAFYYETNRLAHAFQFLHGALKLQEHYTKAGQFWRYIKIVEMLTACCLRREMIDDAQAYASTLSMLYDRYDDPESLIPTTLIAALNGLDLSCERIGQILDAATKIIQRSNSQAAIRKMFPEYGVKK